ncbi:MAG: YceD family protein [Muribaculaceae bacterium]
MDFFREMECTDVLSAAVDATVDVKRSGDIYELCITVAGELGIPCDRCLEQMSHRVDAEYRVSVKYGEEYSDDADNVIVIAESSNTMDVAGLIFDTIMLTIPIKHVHPEGECDAAMQAQLRAHRATIAEEEAEGYAGDEECGEAEADKENDDNFPCDPRWEALRKLKDNN